MKKLISIFIIAVITLCGCTDSNNATDTASEYKVVLPLDDTVNGYRTPEKSESQDDASKTVKYYANLKTKKFHLADCAYAKKAAEENTYISRDKDELISSGYVACKICKP